MNTQEILYADVTNKRIRNLEKNLVNSILLLDRITELESKQANLINDIKKLKKIQAKNVKGLNDQTYKYIDNYTPFKHPLYLIIKEGI